MINKYRIIQLKRKTISHPQNNFPKKNKQKKTNGPSMTKKINKMRMSKTKQKKSIFNDI